MGMIIKQQYVGYLICAIGNFTVMHLAEHLDDVSHHVTSAQMRDEMLRSNLLNESHHRSLHPHPSSSEMQGAPP
jgi:hypothetical protein